MNPCTKELLEFTVKESKTFKEVSRKIKVSYNKVKNKILEFNINISHFKIRKSKLPIQISKDILNIIQSENNNGVTWKNISIKYQIPIGTINKYITFGELKSRKDINRKSIWTPEKRKLFSKKKSEFYKEHPEKHPTFLTKDPNKLTYPEKLAYRYLEECNISFKPQEPIDKYWVDFLVENKLIIEIDGAFWHKGRKEYDENRDLFLESLGYTIKRIPVRNVIENLVNIFKYDIKLDLEKIKNEIIIIKRGSKKYYCECGKEMVRRSKTCRKCKHKKSLKFNITKEELLELLKYKSAPEISKMFNVTRSCVNRAKKRFNIVILKENK